MCREGTGPANGDDAGKQTLHGSAGERMREEAPGETIHTGTNSER